MRAEEESPTTSRAFPAINGTSPNVIRVPFQRPVPVGPWRTRFTMPLASISKETSICGMPRGTRDAGQVDVPSFSCYGRDFALALVDLGLHPHLVVIGRRF